MKRTMAKIFALFCVFLLLTSCGSQPTGYSVAEDYVLSAELVTEPTSPIPETLPQPTTWQRAYADFLRNLTADEYHEEARMLFGLRDLDGNSIPELILLELMPASIDTFNKCVIYTYANGEVRQTGFEPLRYGAIMLSDNPGFPGLFTTNGSSAFVDSYLTINNGELEVIRITGYDDLGFVIHDISAELKAEWMQMGGDDFHIMQPGQSARLLGTHEITEENIRDIIFGWTRLHQVGVEAFAPVLDAYVEFASYDWANSETLPADNFFELALHRGWRRTLQYALHDINGDGRPELFIGYHSIFFDDGILIAVYALQNGVPVRVINARQRTELFLQTHIDGGYVIESTEAVMGSVTKSFYAIDASGEPTVLERLSTGFNRNNDDFYWSRVGDIDWQWAQITEEEYLALIYEYGSFRLTVICKRTMLPGELLIWTGGHCRHAT